MRGTQSYSKNQTCVPSNFIPRTTDHTRSRVGLGCFEQNSVPTPPPPCAAVGIATVMPLQKAQEIRQPGQRNCLCLDRAPAARPCLLFEATGTAAQACAARLASVHAAAPPAPTHQHNCFAQLAQGRPKHTSGTKSSAGTSSWAAALAACSVCNRARRRVRSSSALSCCRYGTCCNAHNTARLFPGSQSPALQHLRP